MATSLLKSFMEAVNPAVGQAAKKACDPQGRKADRRMWPQAAPSVPEADLTSKLALETRTPTVAQPDDVGQGAMQEQVVEGENVLEISGEEIPSMELADQIAVCRPIPVMEPNSLSVNTSLTSISTSMQQLQCEMEDSEEELGDIVQDAQPFQDAALEYQIAYQSIDDNYTHQAVLMKGASEALQA